MIINNILKTLLKGQMKLILTSLFIFVILPSLAFSGGAAPYTKKVVDDLKNAYSEGKAPKFDKNQSMEEKIKIQLKYERNMFKKIGYDYDATINQIVYDMRYHPERIPKTNATESVFGVIYIGLHILMSDCDYFKIDCLQFFPPKTAKSIKWLIDNTDFDI